MIICNYCGTAIPTGYKKRAIVVADATTGKVENDTIICSGCWSIVDDVLSKLVDEDKIAAIDRLTRAG